jgi:plasmid stability protein
MQDKQKVTLYLPPGVHRQLKIRAAIDEQSMSSVVEMAIAFYLKYPEKVQEVEEATYGKTHQVHVCPECEAAMVMREGTLVSLKHQPSVITDDFPLEVPETVCTKVCTQEAEGEAELVPC